SSPACHHLILAYPYSSLIRPISCPSYQTYLTLTAGASLMFPPLFPHLPLFLTKHSQNRSWLQARSSLIVTGGTRHQRIEGRISGESGARRASPRAAATQEARAGRPKSPPGARVGSRKEGRERRNDSASRLRPASGTPSPPMSAASPSTGSAAG